MLLASLLVCLGVTALRADAASAAACSTSSGTPASVAGSSFEGHDGDQCDRPDLNLLVDWENLVNDGEFAPGGNATAIQDAPVDSQFSVFSAPGQASSKEEYPDGWSFDAGSPNAKSDILNAWTYTESQPGGDLYFHFAFESADKPGTVNYNFELNQLGSTFRNKVGYDVPKRSNGDVLIAYDWNGGDSATITLCRWQGAAGVEPWRDGSWVNCRVLNSSEGLGAVNRTPVTNFLPGTTAGGDNVFAPETFGEGSINLTDVLGLGGADAQCVSFGSFWARTRTSTSITSAPKDVLMPQPIRTSNCGTVVIRKVTDPSPDPANPDTSFGFTSTGFTAPATGSPDTSFGAFDLSNGQAETITSVVPGTNYKVTEDDPSAKDYVLDKLVCTESGVRNAHPTTASVATRTANIQVDPNETVTCTFTNRRLPADLKITKTADDDVVSAGDQIGFEIVVRNDGPGIARGVTVRDEVPASVPGLSWSLSPQVQGCQITDGVLTCAFGDLPAGASKTIHVVSPTTDASCALVSNKASADATNDDAVEASDDVRVECPDLAITKTADDGTVSAGDPIGFTIAVSNAGPGIARDVTLRDELPGNGGLQWSVDPALEECQIAEGVLSCDFGDLAKGATKTIHLVSPTSPASCALITNRATADASNDDAVDASDDVRVDCPDLEISKTADADTVSAGDPIGFTIVVHNAGDGIARNATVTDELPTTEGLSWTLDPQVDGCAIEGGTLSCQFGDLGPNESRTVHVSSPTTKDSCSLVSNRATADASNDDEVAADDDVQVNCGDIEITKTADADTVSAGDEIGFTIVVHNAGAGIARGVQVTDRLPVKDGLDWSLDPELDGCAIEGGVLTCQFGDLDPDATRTVHISSPTTKDSCSLIANTASVTTTNDGEAQSGDDVRVNCGDIQITKTADADTVNAGEDIGFTIEVHNAGDGIARGVNVTDHLPVGDGLEWTIDPEVQGCAIDGGVLSCQFGDLDPDATRTVHISSPTTTASCAVISNTAEVTTTNDGAGQATDAVRVDCPDVTITKTAAKDEIGAGEKAGFTIRVTNTGVGTANGVTVTDELPGGLDWQIVSPAGGCDIADGVLECAPVDLATDASFEVVVEATTSLTRCEVYRNTAGYTSTNAGSGTASASVKCLPTIVRVAKVVPGDGADATKFTFTSNLTPNAEDQAAGFQLSEQDGTKVFTVEPGRSYQVTEADPRLKGYVLTAATCRPTDADLAASADENVPEDRTVETGTLAPGADVTCEFTNTQLASAIDVRKTPKSQEVYADGTARYTYEVENIGTADLFTVTVTDDRCSNVTRGADLHGNGDDVLESGEIWRYTCQVAATVLFQGSTAPVTNTVVAKGTDRTERTVQDTDTAVTHLLRPAIAIDKTGPATERAGARITYTLDVTNPGNMAFAEAKVVVTDELCNGKPRLVGKNGDGTPGTLDPGDRWTYQCDVQTTPKQTRVDNVATVDGTDRNGRKVSARDTLTTTLNQLQILPRTASARLRGPSGCPTRATFAYVTGQEITKVVFYVDGKRRATVRRADARGRWKLRIVPKSMRYGRHTVRAAVSFADGSTRSTRPSRLALKFSRCRPNRTPKFTG